MPTSGLNSSSKVLKLGYKIAYSSIKCMGG